MRTILTRSAQKKLAAEPPLTRKAISKQAKVSPTPKTQPKKSPASKAASATKKSPVLPKSIAPKAPAQVKKQVSNQLKLTPKITSTSKLRSQRLATPKSQMKSVNPESPSSDRHVAGKQPRFVLDSSDLQSQESTCFEVQSARGGDTTALETLPSLTSEFEALPKIQPQEQKAPQKTIDTTTARLKRKVNENSGALSPPNKSLPSLQIKSILHKAVSEAPQTPTTELMPEAPVAMQEIATSPAVANPWDQFYENIEETIDEFERRIKAEEIRYSHVVAHRKLYEAHMDPFECRQFFRDSALRLVNFDPNFDSTEMEDLPRPWEHHRRPNSATVSVREAPSNSHHEFAYPSLPRGRY